MASQFAVVRVTFVNHTIRAISVPVVFEAESPAEAERSAKRYVLQRTEVPKDVANRVEFKVCEVLDVDDCEVTTDIYSYTPSSIPGPIHRRDSRRLRHRRRQGGSD